MWLRYVFRTISKAVNCFHKKVEDPQTCNFMKKRDFSTVGFKWNLIFFKISNSNNLFEDIPAMSFMHKISLITCNSHNDKLIWKCIHLPRCCSEQNLVEVYFHICFFRLVSFPLYQATKAFLAFTKRIIYYFHHKCTIQ